MNTTIYLIRHGDIDFADSIPGRLPGLHLSAHGQKQAIWVADVLGGEHLGAVYSSPLDRAMETAIPLANRCGLKVTKMDDLSEIDFGEWTGKRFDELEGDELWKRFHYYRNGTIIPNGELMIDVQRRMLGAIEKIVSFHENENIALVSHNDPIKSLLAYFLGISLDLFLRLIIDTGSISTLKNEEHLFKITGINQTVKMIYNQ